MQDEETKDEHELQAMLVSAITGKQQALVVLWGLVLFRKTKQAPRGPVAGSRSYADGSDQ